VLVAAGLVTGGCGFIAAGDASRTKPSGFVLNGYVSVAGVSAGTAGSACQAPPSVPDIVAGGPVRVGDPGDSTGAVVVTGTLGDGVLAADPAGIGGSRCNFPFQIRNVPGEQQQYVIVVGTRPAATFAGADLRSDKPAVIEVRPS